MKFDIPFFMAPRSIISDATLTTHEKLITLIFYHHADTRGYSFPSLPTIAREAGIARSTAAAVVSSLVAKGFLSRRHRHAAAGGFTSNSYSVSASPPSATRTTPPVRHPDGNDTHTPPTHRPVSIASYITSTPLCRKNPAAPWCTYPKGHKGLCSPESSAPDWPIPNPS